MKKKPNLKKNMRVMLGVFCCLFVLLGTYLLYSTVVYGDQWFTTPYNPRISASKNIENAGTIYDRNGVALAYTENGERKYAESEDVRRAVSHIVGDIYGKSLGAETLYAKYLYGYDQNVVDKFNSAQSGQKGGDVYLTIDSDLSEYIYDNMSVGPGAVVLMNYETGEILASVSKPTFDPNTAKDDTEESGAKFVNRVTQGLYPPGSTMKILTTAAAIENGVTDMEFECTGEDIIEGQRVTCTSVHGRVGLETAFELIYTYLVRTGKITLEKCFELMSYNCADIFGIEGGEIVNFEKANLAVFNLNQREKINPKTFVSQGKSTPFEGWWAMGRCVMTVADGQIVYREGL